MIYAVQRRVVALIKRSPLLKRIALRLHERIPALRKLVAGGMAEPIHEPVAPLLIVPPSAWNDAVPSSNHFKLQLEQMLQRSRQGRK